MAISDFFPEVWAAAFERGFDNATVFGAGVNRRYEGEISAYGDTVKVPKSSVDPTIRDYTKAAIAAPQEDDGTLVDLVINKQKYWHVGVDDVDRAQSKPDHMDELVRKGTRNMAYQVDDDIQAVFRGAANNARTIEDTGTAINDGHFAKINELAQMMDEADIPEEGRFIVVPPRFMAAVWRKLMGIENAGRALSSTLFVPATAEESLRNGFRGRLRTFDVRVSNRIVVEGAGATARIPCYASHPDGVSMATQLTEIEAYRRQDRFMDAVRALMLYGIKDINPEFVFELKINAGLS